MPFVRIVPRADLTSDDCKALAAAIGRWRQIAPGLLALDEAALLDLEAGELPQPLALRTLSELRRTTPSAILKDVILPSPSQLSRDQLYSGRAICAYCHNVACETVRDTLADALPARLLEGFEVVDHEDQLG